MKQILRKAIALILAATAVLFPLAQMATLIRTTDSAKLASSIETADTNSVVIKAAIEKHYDGDGWNFEPRTSDGGHITPQGDGMHLKGHPDEAFFVFEKTAALEFTAEFDAGWTYNSKYSYFFGNDSEAAEVKKLADGSVKFTYRVKKGAKIAVTELTAACALLYASTACGMPPTAIYMRKLRMRLLLVAFPAGCPSAASCSSTPNLPLSHAQQNSS